MCLRTIIKLPYEPAPAGLTIDAMTDVRDVGHAVWSGEPRFWRGVYSPLDWGHSFVRGEDRLEKERDTEFGRE